MTYTPYYLAVETAQFYLGNTATQNIHTDMDEAAARFADGTISGEVGAPIPSTSIFFSQAVGIAYLLYKVQRQNGVETEDQRELDWKIATESLAKLKENMIATGEIDALVGGSVSIDGGPVGLSAYETNPLNPMGKITFGARNRAGTATVLPNSSDPSLIA